MTKVGTRSNDRKELKDLRKRFEIVLAYHNDMRTQLTTQQNDNERLKQLIWHPESIMARLRTAEDEVERLRQEESTLNHLLGAFLCSQHGPCVHHTIRLMDTLKKKLSPQQLRTVAREAACQPVHKLKRRR